MSHVIVVICSFICTVVAINVAVSRCYWLAPSRGLWGVPWSYRPSAGSSTAHHIAGYVLVRQTSQWSPYSSPPPLLQPTSQETVPAYCICLNVSCGYPTNRCKVVYSTNCQTLLLFFRNVLDVMHLNNVWDICYSYKHKRLFRYALGWINCERKIESHIYTNS